MSTTGEVIELLRGRQTGEYVRSRTKNGVKIEKKYLYRPVIRYKTQSGVIFDFTAGIAMRPAPYQVGELVEVIYDPQNPRQAQINQFLYLWFYTLMLVSFGLFFLGVGLLGVILS